MHNGSGFFCGPLGTADICHQPTAHVRSAEYGNGPYGNRVIIDHGSGLFYQL
jgi:hypothetical protein